MSVYFSSCEKDAHTVFSDSPLENRYDSIEPSLTGIESEFYNWFNFKKDSISQLDTILELTPYEFEIDWNSGIHLPIFGENAYVYNVYNSPLAKTKYYRHQIIIEKKSEFEISARVLTYLADSSFYIENSILPDYYYFTGKIIECKNGNSDVKNIYDVYLGIIMATISHIDSDDALDFRNGRRIKCPSASGKHHHWRGFKKWLRHVFSSGGIVDMDDAGSWWWGNFNWGDDTESGGNGSFSYPSGGGGFNDGDGDNWNIPNTDWVNTKNYRCVMENLEVLKSSDDFNLDMFNDPCSSIKTKLERLKAALIYECARNNNESNLDDPDARNKFYDHVKKITAPDCKECENAIINFKEKYGIDLTDEKYEDVYYAISDCSNQDEFEEEAKITLLTTLINLTDDEKNWLKTKTDVLDKIFTYKINNTYPELDFEKVIRTMSQGGEITLDDYINTYGIWGNLENPDENIGKPEEIENGITIINTEIAEPTIYSSIFAQSPSKGSTEDLLSETDANDKGIFLRSDLSDDIYFSEMDLLFNLTTVLDGEMEDIADGFVQQFRDDIGGTRHDPLLDAKIKEHPSMHNYIKKFGKILNEKLKEKNGDIYAIELPIELTKIRPKFPSIWDRFHGYQILINDTEQTDIILDSYIFDETTKEWTATFKFVVFDHFGLDKHDVLLYQVYSYGFSAWWRLQHKRGYDPFTTKIWIKATIKGNIDN